MLDLTSDTTIEAGKLLNKSPAPILYAASAAGSTVWRCHSSLLAGRVGPFGDAFCAGITVLSQLGAVPAHAAY